MLFHIDKCDDSRTQIFILNRPKCIQQMTFMQKVKIKLYSQQQMIIILNLGNE